MKILKEWDEHPAKYSIRLNGTVKEDSSREHGKRKNRDVNGFLDSAKIELEQAVNTSE